jgi:hypothetical protein
MNRDDLPEDLTADLPGDSLDDASRRALLARLARIGATAVPVSMVVLDATKAQANTGSFDESPGTGF